MQKGAGLDQHIDYKFGHPNDQGLGRGIKNLKLAGSVDEGVTETPLPIAVKLQNRETE